MKRQILRRLAVAGTILLAATLFGCGGSDHNNSGGGGHNSGSQPTASASVPAGATFNAGDVTFAKGMVPHHQQAIEMARVAETRASNAQVKDLAARIRTAQDPEIATMSGWLRQWGQSVPTSAPGMGHGGSGMPGMMTDQEMKDLMAASGTSFDRMFLQMMIRHHQGAIEMATAEQQQGKDPQATQLAAKIAADQTAEIKEMQDLLGKR
jgi:uncharacterized protein (DUF305 family)